MSKIRLSPESAETYPVSNQPSSRKMMKAQEKINGRVLNAELKITPEALTSTVTNSSFLAPAVKYIGMLWLDTTNKPYSLKRWDGTEWVNTSVTKLTELGGEPTIHKATTAPSAPAEGTLWLDTSVVPNILKRYTGGVWISANFTQSQIEQTANSISSSVVAAYAYSKGNVDTTLLAYSTTEQTSQAITNTVASHYTNTVQPALNGKVETSVLVNYSTTAQTATSITNTVGSYDTNTVQPALNGKADTSMLANYSTLTQTASDITLAINTRRSRNLFTNSDFENGLTDWTAMGAGTVLMDGSVNTTLDGGKNLLVDTVTGVIFAGVYKYVSGLTVGKKYTLSGYFYNESNFAIYSDSAGSGLTSLPGGGWTRSSVTFTATSATAELLYIISNGASTGSGACYMDRLQLEEGEVMTPWNRHPSELPTGALYGAKYRFDGTGATFTNGGLLIKNNAGTTVMSATTAGDIQVTGEMMVGQTAVNAGLSGSGTLATSVRIWAGHATPSTLADFYVLDNGTMKAHKGNIAGWDVSATAITSPSTKLKLDSANNRIYVNSSAYFYAGTTSTKMYLSGAFEATGQILSPDVVSSGTLTASGAYSTVNPSIIKTAVVLQFASGGTQYILTRDASGFVKATTTYTG